jgi:hypothetical protein
MSQTLVETIAPFSPDLIRRNFTEQGLVYVVDYGNSRIKGKVFLTYLSNLDLRYHVRIRNVEEACELLQAYLTLPMLVKVPELEDTVVEVLAAAKGLPHNLTFDPSEFIAANREIIDHWNSVVDSLALYALFCHGEEQHKEFIESHEVDDTSDPVGSNFVHLCTHPKLPLLINPCPEQPVKFYSKYFTTNMFRGQNLFHFWGKAENMLYVSYVAMVEDPAGFQQSHDALQAAVLEKHS